MVFVRNVKLGFVTCQTAGCSGDDENARSFMNNVSIIAMSPGSVALQSSARKRVVEFDCVTVDNRNATVEQKTRETLKM